MGRNDDGDRIYTREYAMKDAYEESIERMQHYDTWNNDLIQFARLICEIRATQDTLRIDLLCKEMDLRLDDIADLFNRAHNIWEDVK